MKLISRVTTALFCSAIAFGLTIPGDAETTITDSSDKDSSFNRVFLNSEVTFNQNKQTENKQSSKEIVGYWVGTNSKEIEVSLLLQDDGRYTLIFTALDKRWKYYTGSWNFSNNSLSLKDDDDNSITTQSVEWISNNEFVSETVKFRRTDQNANPLNSSILGTWSIKKPQIGGILRKTLINFQSNGKAYYQNTEIYPSLSTIDRQDIVVSSWKWQVGNYLNVRNDGSENFSICRVYWISNSEFICVHSSKNDSNGRKEQFTRTEDRIKTPELNTPLY